jgi:hypothetical protein
MLNCRDGSRWALETVANDRSQLVSLRRHDRGFTIVFCIEDDRSSANGVLIAGESRLANIAGVPTWPGGIEQVPQALFRFVDSGSHKSQSAPTRC